MVLWITLLLLAANFSGYVVVLYLLARWVPVARAARRFPLEPQAEDPEVYALVPVWNEREYLRRKIEDLLRQRYAPGKLKILLCDAGSTDGGLHEVRDLPGVRVLHCPRRGKIAQLNFGLAQVPPGALVVISDADALLARADSLLRAADYFADPRMGAVGAWTIPNPESALATEKAYWDKQNRLRALETRACTASIVTAQFYAFRRSLIDFFPEDCVADDVFLAFAAHARGLRVVYADDIEAVERRQPRSERELFRHKFRKAHAYTVELLRPLHRIAAFSKRRKFIYLFKIYQFFYLPWIAALFLVSCAIRAYHGEWLAPVAAFAFLFFTTLFASMLIEPPPGKTRGGFSPVAAFHTVMVFSLVNLVLMANSLTFPFWSQSSRYARVGGE